MSGTHLVAYALTVSVLIMMPGADFAVVLRNAVRGGRRAAQGAGIAVGLLGWTAAVATGLGALLAASTTAYTVVKIACVVYLMYLGVMSLWAAWKHRGTPATEVADVTALKKPRSTWQAFREVALT